MSIEHVGESEAVRLGTMEDALTDIAHGRLLSGDYEYRPDVSKKETMHYIQVQLARRGLTTIMSSRYQRGREEPLTYALVPSDVIVLDSYR